MDDRDLIETAACVICGEEVDPRDAATFYAAPSAAVCYECARRNGGQYDPEVELWKKAPDLPVLKLRMPSEWDY